MSDLEQLRAQAQQITWRKQKTGHVLLLEEMLRMIDLLVAVDLDEQLREIRRLGT